MFEAHEVICDDQQYDMHVRWYVRAERVRLCNLWDLELADGARADLECRRENLRRGVRELPEGRRLQSEDRFEVPEVHDFRLELCGELGLVTGEQQRFDSFILDCAAAEIARRLKAQGAKAKRAKAKRPKARVRKAPHILPKGVPQGAATRGSLS